MNKGCAAAFGCLLIPLLLVGGCVCISLFYNREVWVQRQSIAERNDASGKGVEQLITETTWARRGPLPGPHGMSMVSFDIGHKLYAQKGAEMPGREIPFFRKRRNSTFFDRPLGVVNSRLWVVQEDCKYDPYWKPLELKLLIFDDQGLVRERTFDRDCRGFPVEMYLRNRDGNQTLIFPTRDGFQAYHVITDTVTPWTDPPNGNEPERPRPKKAGRGPVPSAVHK